ncbi:MAG: hypothetical protein IJX26_02995 [Clostridia bacterium]|nr:hypothetical protein [Clostridia bacterium]
MQTIGVVYNISPKIDYFLAPEDVKVGDFCLVNSPIGLEFCKVVEINSQKNAENEIERLATSEDIKTNTQNIIDGNDIRSCVLTAIKQHGLSMKLSKCVYTFDKSKLIIHYTADDRVDFRELVKDLANELKTRIEMHQINSRDETQIMGALGCCGRVCCCKNHLSDFDKVSIKMAKKQGLSLNPQNLNGMCGKLMCCLRYEDEVYTEALEKMHAVGTKVQTPDGIGVVKSNDCLREIVNVQFQKGDETEFKSYNLVDVVPVEDKNE